MIILLLRKIKMEKPVPYRKKYLTSHTLSYPNINSIITNEGEKTSAGQGTTDLKNVLFDNVFHYPKPVNLIKKLLRHYINKNAVVLDFFAGSGTTGQAVLELNREDGGQREFILCTNNENNIAYDVTYERLYRLLVGKGTKGEINFKWIKQNKAFTNDGLQVFVL